MYHFGVEIEASIRPGAILARRRQASMARPHARDNHRTSCCGLWALLRCDSREGFGLTGGLKGTAHGRFARLIPQDSLASAGVCQRDILKGHDPPFIGPPHENRLNESIHVMRAGGVRLSGF